jgi:hypothetical protein
MNKNGKFSHFLIFIEKMARTIFEHFQREIEYFEGKNKLKIRLELLKLIVKNPHPCSSANDVLDTTNCIKAIELLLK